jgi:hypothetical protein
MVNSNGDSRVLEERPQRWSDDPPVGTEVILGGGFVEVYVGRGIWLTVAVS